MMNAVMTVENTEMQIREYNGQRVVTFKDIDMVHKRPKGTAKRNFATNKRHFIKDEDYYSISREEFGTKFVPNENRSAGNPNLEVILLTETGYLMLVKSFRDAKNVLYGGNNVYADLTRHFMRVDGSQLFLPRNESTIIEKTGYVTSLVSDVDGLFKENPVLSIKLPAAYTYYGVYVTFQGNPPKEMKIRTYNNDKLVNTFEYRNLKEKSLLNDEFENFDRMEFEITKAYPVNRVLIDNISFGDLSDYTLTKDSMLESPLGYAEKKTKDILVTIELRECN